MIKTYAIVMLVGLSATTLSAQKDLRQKAQRHAALGQYDRVLSTLDQAEKESADRLSLIRAMALLETHQLDQAEDLLGRLKADNQHEALFYLAQISQSRADYEQAISQYKDYIRQAKKDDPRRAKAIRQIKHCAYSIKNSHQEELAFVENIGKQINSLQDDYGAIQSPTYSDRYYFNSAREGVTGARRDEQGEIDYTYGDYRTDMFYVEADQGIWSDAYVLDPELNTAQDEVVLDFQPDGSRMLYAQSSTSGSSVIFANSFSQDTTSSPPQRFSSKIVGELGDQHIHMYSDSIFLFSSRRAGGEGGYDIYITEYTAGQWLEPKNLGAEINTRYNELSPFLSADGLKLYYSADAPAGYGGYDIYMSEYDEKKQQWSTPQNLGLPINSMKDELYYRISASASTATFSSDRYEGLGGLDLYIAYLKEPEESHTVYADHVPFLDDAKRAAGLDSAMIVAESPQPAVAQSVADDGAVEKASYPIKPLLIDASGKVMQAQNRDAARRIIQLLQEHPRMIIELQGHTPQEGPSSLELYYSLRRTDDLVDYLLAEGITQDRIIQRGFGNQLMTANEMIAKTRDYARIQNSRVNVIFHRFDPERLAFDYQHQTANAAVSSDQYEAHQAKIQGLSYRIEIARVNQLLQSELINASTASMIEAQGGSYLYTVGLYQYYRDAASAMTEIQQSETAYDLAIIPYVDGLRVSPEAIDALIEQYPDLVNYQQD